MSARVSLAEQVPTTVDRTARDHVTRIVDSHFDVRDNELHIGGVPVSELAAQFGTPLFVYDQGVIERKIRELHEILPDCFSLFYSIKANPNAAILKCALQQGCGLEVASGGELLQALEAGCPGGRIIFAGPGKTPSELMLALEAAIREVHIESIEEARRLDRLARERGRVATVCIRVNPVEGAGGAMRMGGQASPFGVDEENLQDVVTEILSLPQLKLAGIHLYMATQVLDAEVLVRQYRRAVDIAHSVAKRLPQPLATIDFGGGLGTPYFPHEEVLDLQALEAGMASIADQLTGDPLLAGVEAILEPGRFLVSEAGVYLSTVTRVKESRGKTFAVLDGGMHHHLAASGNLGQTIKRNYPVAIVNKLRLPGVAPVDVVGPLCTPLDALARQAILPRVESGDLFGIFQSGAYARTASPHGFLSHASPAEVMTRDGQASLIRRRGEPNDYLRDQLF